MVDWRRLPEAIALTYGDVADTACSAIAGEITAWRHPTLPEPTQAELLALLEQLDVQFARQSKLAELDRCCTNAICAGFESSALGGPHRYSSRAQDQQNLTQAVTLALVSNQAIAYVCTDSAGIKTARLHTPAQLNQVFTDGGAHKRELIYHFHTLRAQVEVATAIAAIRAVQW